MSELNSFEPFSKIPRLSRECTITEKIDGTNAQIYIVPTIEASCTDSLDGATVIGDRSIPGSVNIFVGSRNRWITPGNDNYGFAAWVKANAEELTKLGPGRHFGEWWGAGIQRRYNQTEKHFSLFNVNRWCPPQFAVGTRFEESKMEVPPTCCSVVPVLYRGDFDTAKIQATLTLLGARGSQAAPGFMDPEGIVVWHSAARQLFKKTCKNDESPKGAPMV